MPSHLLQIRNLYKSFDGINAVDDLSFDIAKGSIVALLGPNGSGKTTAFNLVCGYLQPARGGIYLNGNDITSLSPSKIAHLGIGRTFQNTRLFPQLSVLENIMMAFKHSNGERFWTSLLQTKRMKGVEYNNHQRAEELLNFVGLQAKIHELAENLSHGQRKLLELARVLALDPEVFLLDEPLAGLSPQARRAMLNLLKNLNSKGKTIFFIEHDMNSVMDIAQKIIVLNFGKKIAEGSPNEIIKNKEVLRAYIGKKVYE